MTARDLRPGDLLLDRHVGDVMVTAVSSREQAAEVFHLEVERFHTYAVGRSGILVHNVRMSCDAVEQFRAAGAGQRYGEHLAIIRP